MTENIVLASGSSARRQLLERAGVAVVADPAVVDEAEVKASFRAAGAAAADCTLALAELKAQRVSRRHPGALVIGADQMLECGAVWFDKPADADHARAQLMALRGKTHELIGAVVVVQDGTRLWHHLDRARLTMRPFSDAFLNHYLATAGPEILSCVGCYQLEGPGAQLFQRIEGDYFSILGLPLLPVLDFLRSRGAVPR